MVEESATSVCGEVAEELGNNVSTAEAEEGDRGVGLSVPELDEEST